MPLFDVESVERNSLITALLSIRRKAVYLSLWWGPAVMDSFLVNCKYFVSSQNNLVFLSNIQKKTIHAIAADVIWLHCSLQH